MDWVAIGAIGSLLSGIVLLVAAVAALFELDHLARERFVTTTNAFFQVWEHAEFQHALWLIVHDLDATSWPELAAQREMEEAVVMVSTFFNRMGTVIRLNLVASAPLIANTGYYGVEVWDKLRPIVNDVRKGRDAHWLLDYEHFVAVVGQLHEGAAAVPTDGYGAGTGLRLMGLFRGNPRLQ